MELVLASVRTLHFAATILLFGEIAFVWLLWPARVMAPRTIAIAASCVAIAAATAIAWIFLEAHGMSGLPLGEALAPGTIKTVATQTFFGRVWMMRMGVLAALGIAIALLHRRGPSMLPLALALAFLLLALLAGMGHAAGARGSERSAHLAVDAVHLVAAGAWVGTLLPLARMLGEALRQGDAAAVDAVREATRRYSRLGAASVGALALTGLVNMAYNNIPLDAHGLVHLSGTEYGRLLIAKLALVAVMVAFALLNRIGLTPALSSQSPQPSLRLLRRNALAEFVLGVAVLAIVAKLGITMPVAPHSHGPAASAAPTAAG